MQLDNKVRFLRLASLFKRLDLVILCRGISLPCLMFILHSPIITDKDFNAVMFFVAGAVASLVKFINISDAEQMRKQNVSQPHS